MPSATSAFGTLELNRAALDVARSRRLVIPGLRAPRLGFRHSDGMTATGWMARRRSGPANLGTTHQFPGLRALRHLHRSRDSAAGAIVARIWSLVWPPMTAASWPAPNCASMAAWPSSSYCTGLSGSAGVPHRVGQREPRRLLVAAGRYRIRLR